MSNKTSSKTTFNRENRDVIIACDFYSTTELFSFLENFKGEERPYLKIGMQLFYAAGLSLVHKLKNDDYKIFLDLKLHDIPNTVKNAMAVLSDANVDMVNVHASGGSRMMKAALEGIREGKNDRDTVTKLIAVTQLTSTSQEDMNFDLGLPGKVEDVVLKYALNAKNAGLDGVVCSPHEASKMHEKLGSDFLTVTPGIRFDNSVSDDQRRIMTPLEAGKAGSDYIVVGRPITKSSNPLSAYRKCIEDFLL